MADNISKSKFSAEELKRCSPEIRRILLMKRKNIVRAKKKDIKRIKTLINRLKSEDSEKLVITAHPVFGPIDIKGFLRRRIRIRAILNFAGNRYDLEDMNIKIESHTQYFFTVNLTKKKLEELIAQPATIKVSLPRIFLPYLADAIPVIEVDQVHIQGTKGNGVIVGVIDTTLHVMHYAFRNPNAPNNTRVKFMWVQEPDDPNAAGQTPEAYFNDNINHPNSPDFTDLNYGRIYDEDTINIAIASGSPYGSGINKISKEPRGLGPLGPQPEHGTLVTGIAAGSGHTDDSTQLPINIGAAPLADIVHVHYRAQGGSQSGAFENDIINALDFILRIATHNGQPVVINNSYGTQVGPHTGNMDFDKLRDAMLDSYLGRSIVFAAGNDNDTEGIRKGTVIADSITSFSLTPNEPNPYDIWLYIAYKGSDLDFKMDCGDGTTEWISAPNEFDGRVFDFDIIVARDEDLDSNTKIIKLYINDATSISPWTINFRNNGTTNVDYRAWVGVKASVAYLEGSSINELTLGDTGCSRAILTVGACKKPVDNNAEQIENYSGCGPTLDGRIKPEIVTIGEAIESADSSNTGGYLSKSGTSMSAPLVAGSIALLFENNSSLNQDEIKALLTQNADKTDLDIDPEAPGYDQIERNAYGYGRLRMSDPFFHTWPLADVDVWVRTADDDFGFQPYPGGCFCHAPEIKVFDSNNVETTTLNWGQEQRIQVTIHNLGDNPALNVSIKLKYTRPWTAPNNWVPCEDSSNDPIEELADIPALSAIDFEFNQKWKPELGEIPPGGAEWGDHYCLLVELDHPNDPLHYDDATAEGQNPWNKNIKGTNNVALKNLHIQ